MLETVVIIIFIQTNIDVYMIINLQILLVISILTVSDKELNWFGLNKKTENFTRKWFLVNQINDITIKFYCTYVKYNYTLLFEILYSNV